jgi:hypothetical protein
METFWYLDIPTIGKRVFDTRAEAKGKFFFFTFEEITRERLQELYDEHGDDLEFSDAALERFLG